MPRLDLGEGGVGGSSEQLLLRARPTSALLRGFDDAELAALGAHLEIVTAKDQQRIMLRGQRALWVGVLLKGTVRVSQHGRELRILGPGDALGETALLRDGFRAADGTADGEVILGMLMLDRFHALPAELALKLHAACARSAIVKQRAALSRAGGSARPGAAGVGKEEEEEVVTDPLLPLLQARLAEGGGVLGEARASKTELLLLAQHMHFARFKKGDRIVCAGILLQGSLSAGGKLQGAGAGKGGTAGGGGWTVAPGDGFGEFGPAGSAPSAPGVVSVAAATIAAASASASAGAVEAAAHFPSRHDAIVLSDEATVALLPYPQLLALGRRDGPLALRLCNALALQALDRLDAASLAASASAAAATGATAAGGAAADATGTVTHGRGAAGVAGVAGGGGDEVAPGSDGATRYGESTASLLRRLAPRAAPASAAPASKGRAAWATLLRFLRQLAPLEVLTRTSALRALLADASSAAAKARRARAGAGAPGGGAAGSDDEEGDALAAVSTVDAAIAAARAERRRHEATRRERQRLEEQLSVSARLSADKEELLGKLSRWVDEWKLKASNLEERLAAADADKEGAMRQVRADLDKLKAAVGPDWQAVLRGEGGGSASSVGEQLVRLRDELGKARALNGSLQADFERRQREAKAHHSLTLRVLEGRIAELARRLREAAAKLDTATQRALGNAHAARRALEDGDACADALLAAIARLEARALRAEASEGSAHGATASLEARVASLSAEIDRLRPLEGVAARVDAEAEASRKRFGRARTAAQALSVVYLRQVFLLRRRAREAEARRGALADALAHERGLRRELAVQLEGTVEAANGTRATLLKAVLAAEGKAESERRQLDAVRVQLAEVRRRADGTASELEVAQARERRAEEEQVRLRAKADDALSRLREADGRRQDLLRFFELAFERMLELEGSFGSLMHSDAAGRAAASLASTSLASSHAAALAAKAGAASLAGARAGCAPSASSACAAAPTAAEHGGGGGNGGDGDGGSAHKGGEGGQCGEGASGGAQPAHAADAAAPAPASLHLSPSPAEIQRRFDEQQTVAMAALRALQRSWTIRAALTEQHERFVNAQLPAMGPRSGTAARAARAVHAAGLSGTRPLSASLAPLGDIAHGPAGSPPRGLGSAPAAGVGAGGLGALAGTSAVYGAGRMRSISPPPLPLAQRRALSPEPGGGSALVESQQPKPLSAVLPRVDVSGSCAGGGGGGGGTSHGGGSVWAAASGPMLFGGRGAGVSPSACASRSAGNTGSAARASTASAPIGNVTGALSTAQHGAGGAGRHARRALDMHILERGLLGPDLARAALLSQTGMRGTGRTAMAEGLRAAQPSSQPIFKRGEVAQNGVRGGALLSSGSAPRGLRGSVARDQLTAGLQLVVLEKEKDGVAPPSQAEVTQVAII